MTRLEDITVFNDIRERLEAITATQMEVVAARLGPVVDGETPIGELNPPTRALWTLALLLKSEHNIEEALASQLIDSNITDDHAQRAMIADQLEDAVIELMWAQARTDIGYWKPTAIGIRKDWVLVEMQNPPSPMESLLRGMSGGGVGGSGGGFRP